MSRVGCMAAVMMAALAGIAVASWAVSGPGYSAVVSGIVAAHAVVQMALMR